MADFSRDSVRSARHVTIHHDATADAGPHRHHDHVLEPHASSESSLGPCGRRTIVLYDHRKLGCGFEYGANRDLGPGEIGREVDHRARLVHTSRDTNAHTDDGAVDTGLKLVDDVGDVVQDRTRIVPGSGTSRGSEDVPASVHHSRSNLGSADVNTDGDAWCDGVHGVRLGPADR
jgi:hypothetical protein